jgi:uroporphyrinogen-III synthase
MSPWPQEGARIYMRRRLLADRLFEECQVLYRCLHEEGINTERVEAYTLARDAYEEAVLDFGKAREMLEEVFTKTVDLFQANQ